MPLKTKQLQRINVVGTNQTAKNNNTIFGKSGALGNHRFPT